MNKNFERELLDLFEMFSGIQAEYQEWPTTWIF